MAMLSKVQRGYGDPLDVIGREFDTALNRFFGQGNGGHQYMAPYGVDIREDADHLYVEADLPGFKKEEVDITCENQTLTISAEHKEEQKDQKSESGDWLLNERRYARFLRSFTLPPTVDVQNVNAKLQDGVLKLVLNKREETKPRKIQVA